MERVTFQDESLVARIRETCVATWRNVVPGFETASIDELELSSTRRGLRELAGMQPGTASNNIATLFSSPEGHVLHVAPGLHSPEDLRRELDFALSVDAAVEAGRTPRLKRIAYTEAHRWRRVDRKVPESARRVYERVHETLSSRPLLALDALRLADYTQAVLFDAETTRKQGRSLQDWVEKQAAASRPKPVRRPITAP